MLILGTRSEDCRSCVSFGEPERSTLSQITGPIYGTFPFQELHKMGQYFPENNPLFLRTKQGKQSEDAINRIECKQRMLAIASHI